MESNKDIKDLREEVCRANLALVKHGLVTLTWGNASAVDRQAGLIVIKASGVPYETMTANDMVAVSLKTGKVLEGDLRPSSDTPTHWALYQAFANIGAIVHTHSTYATMFSQAGMPIPCLGTTHADHFFGEVPVARHLTEAEIEENYELHSGTVIIELFRAKNLDPLQVPAVLLRGHAPFTFGKTPPQAVDNSVALEACAKMAIGTRLLNPALDSLPEHVLKKHFLRKHGPGAYYGQK
jgi:L-ribulose-5-phosphate 4-epimerase